MDGKDRATATLYELRLYAGAGVGTALAFGLVLPWVFWNGWADPGGGEQARTALNVIELFGVIAAPLLGASLLSREEENQTAEVLLSKPVGRTRLVARRVGLALGALVVMVLVPAATYLGCGVRLPLAEVLAVAGPGALLLAALGLAVATWTGISAAGYLAPMAYWAFDWGTRGAHTGYLTLFARAVGRSWWAESKVALVALALVLIGLSAWGLGRRQRA